MTERDIFLGAIDIPDAAARSAYLEGACGGNAALRSRVEELLHAHEEAGSFLNIPALGSTNPDAPPTRTFGLPAPDPGDGLTRTRGEGAEETADALAFLAPPRRPDAIGRIGQYEVLEVLGRGGFGVVFRAHDEVLQRVVAVKVLAPSMAATSPARKRFLREACSAAQVQHENVVRIHATGAEPLPYLVMEFVPGETLQQRLDRIGPLEVAEALRLGRQIADGLAAAHARGLIHRDIKPSNVLIESGPEPRAKITDFGLARAADDASLTRSGVVAGTPMYMAPEQARGEALDHRADLFSLGSVLYAMLTGRPPFRAENTPAVLKRVAEDTPRPIHEVIAEVPEWLCRIVEKLHAKDPARRFQSAKEVADLLGQCLAHLEKPAVLPLPPFAEVRPVSTEPAADPYRQPLPLWLRWAVLLAAFLAVLMVFLPVQTETRLDVSLGLVLVVIAVMGAKLFGTFVSRLRVVPLRDALPRKGVVAGNLMLAAMLLVVGLYPRWYFYASSEAEGLVGAIVVGLIIAGIAGVLRHLGRIEGRVQAPPAAGAPGGAPPVRPPREVWKGVGVAALVLLGLSVAFVSETWRAGYVDSVWPVFLTAAGAGGLPGWLMYMQHWWARTRSLRLILAASALLILGGLVWAIVVWNPHLQPGSVTVHVSEPGLVVTIDGKPVEPARPGSAGVFFAPGTHHLRAYRNAKLVYQENFTLATGETRVIDVPPTLPTPAPKDGFVSLFNGKDLTGWKPHPLQPGKWRVEDGVLVGSGTTTHLFTERGDYKDFHLRVETRINARGDGGVMFRCSKDLWRGQPVGYEAEIISPTLNRHFQTGSLYCKPVVPLEGGTGVALFTNVEEVNRADVWFTLEIIARGKHLTTLVNGRRVADVTNDEHRSGFIALQVIEEETVVQFRKIEIKELTPDDEFAPLFNGKDLTGWRTFPDDTAGTWEVGDGVIQGKLRENKQASWLVWTGSTHRDFHLRAEVRVGDGGLGGVAFRWDYPKLNPSGNPDAWLAVINSNHPSKTRTGSLYQLGTERAVKERLVMPDVWFTYEIVAQGEEVELRVNGKPTVKHRDAQRLFRGAHIALETASPGDAIQFRKIEIKDLPAPGK